VQPTFAVVRNLRPHPFWLAGTPRTQHLADRGAPFFTGLPACSLPVLVVLLTSLRQLTTMSVSLPGLERDDRGRIKVVKGAIRAELGSAVASGSESPTWSSMLSGRLVGKYDLSSPSEGAAALRSGALLGRCCELAHCTARLRNPHSCHSHR
jgi:hypothetical protein